MTYHDESLVRARPEQKDRAIGIISDAYSKGMITEQERESRTAAVMATGSTELALRQATEGIEPPPAPPRRPAWWRARRDRLAKMDDWDRDIARAWRWGYAAIMLASWTITGSIMSFTLSPETHGRHDVTAPYAVAMAVILGTGIPATIISAIRAVVTGIDA